MIGRRALLAKAGIAGLSLVGASMAGLAGTACSATLAEGPDEGSGTGVPASDRLAFDVFRKGSHIGTHHMTFAQTGDLLTVRTEVAIAVGFGPITLYRYRHQAIEVWRGDTFAALSTNTDDDGVLWSVRATRHPDGVRIAASRDKHASPPLLLPEATIPLTHWNRLVTERPLFDPQEGVAAPETVTPRGRDRVALADGATVPATRFDFAGKVRLSDWYDDKGLWTALQATVKDGSILDYRRIV